MNRNGNAVLALLLLTSIVLAAGCAGTREADEPSGDRLEFPDWVRIAMPQKEGRDQFVGGAVFGESLEAGIELADIDARSQIHQEAVRIFTDRFNRCVQQCGVETTPMERLDLKNRISQPFAELMSELGRIDDQYHRPCGEGEQADAPVCQIFVLMSVGSDEWSTVLAEVLSEEKRRRSEEGESHLAEFLEHMIRGALEDAMGQGREPRR